MTDEYQLVDYSKTEVFDGRLGLQQSLLILVSKGLLQQLIWVFVAMNDSQEAAQSSLALSFGLIVPQFTSLGGCNRFFSLIFGVS